MLKRISLIIILYICIAGNTFSQGLLVPYNLNFELGAVGYEPPQWDASNSAQKQGYVIITTDSLSHSGHKSLVINSPDTKDTSTIAFVKQSINARNYRANKVNFGAYLLAFLDNEQSFAFLWANVRDKDGNIIASFSSQDNPITSGNWTRFSIMLDIPQNAETINYGFALKGSGTVFIDNANFDLIQSDPKYYAKQSNLSASALDNLVAFAEIFGLVKYFYPNFYSDKIDWNNFLIAGIEKAESAKNSDEFVKLLNPLVNSVAPEAKLNNKLNLTPNNNLPSYAWLHTGVPSNYANAVSNSKMINLAQSQRTSTALAMQRTPISVGKIHPTGIELSAECSLAAENSSAFGNILVRFEDENNRIISFTSFEPPFVKSPDQNTYSLKTKVPDNTKFIRLAANLDGEGSFSVRKIELKIYAKTLNNPRRIIIDFESEPLVNWNLLDESARAGYQFSAENGFLKLFSTQHNKILRPNNTYSLTLQNSVEYSQPLVLNIDSVANANYNVNFRTRLLTKPADFVPATADRHSRIALVIDLWNYLVHFAAPENDRPKMLNLLRSAIAKVAAQSDSLELEKSLNELLASIKDNNALIEKYSPGLSKYLPFLLKYFDGKLIVAKNHKSSALQPGDEITEIEGIPASQALEQTEQFIAVPNPAFRKIIAINKLTKGAPDSKVQITALRNGKPVKVVETRSLLAGELIEERPERYEIFGDSTIYCDLTRTTDKELNEIAKFMEKFPCLIFDLRGKSQVSEYFLGLLADNAVQSFPIVTSTNTEPFGRSRNSYSIYTNIKPYRRLANKQIFFLCDERSVGLSEAILAIARHNKLGTIIGRPTSGSAGEICSIALPCGYYLTATTAKVVSPDGGEISGSPISPDITVNYDINFIKNNIDDILFKTLEIIKNSRNK
ncbi:MAG: S41 family peptidase [Bacteroidota bacterium]